MSAGSTPARLRPVLPSSHSCAPNPQYGRKSSVSCRFTARIARSTSASVFLPSEMLMTEMIMTTLLVRLLRKARDQERGALDLPIEARQVHCLAGCVTPLAGSAEADEPVHLAGDEGDVAGAALERIQLLHLLESKRGVDLVKLAEQGAAAGSRWHGGVVLIED